MLIAMCVIGHRLHLTPLEVMLLYFILSEYVFEIVGMSVVWTFIEAMILILAFLTRIMDLLGNHNHV